MILWIECLIAGFVFYEAVIISIFKLLQKENPAMNTWLILVSKALKILITLGVILLVKNFFTEIPIRRFALITVAIYLVSTVVETIFFLKKEKK